MYDPVIGRWISPDPYGQYWSPYVGMGNNPVNRFDPDGGTDRPTDCPKCEPGMVLDEIVVKPGPVENNSVKNDGFFTSIGKGFSEYGNMWKDMIPAVNWVNLVLTDPNGAGPNAKDLPDPRPNARVVEHELRSLQQQLFDPLGLVVNQKQKIVLGPVSQVDLLKNATDVHLGINPESGVVEKDSSVVLHYNDFDIYDNPRDTIWMKLHNQTNMGREVKRVDN